jgi:hypothetical protein
MERLIGEAIEIELHPHNIYIEECLHFGKACKPLLHKIREKDGFQTRNSELRNSTD